MTKYSIQATVTVSCWTVVDADSLEEAIALAKQRSMAQHHIDGSNPEDECWNFDNDGTPDGLRVQGE